MTVEGQEGSRTEVRPAWSLIVHLHVGPYLVGTNNQPIVSRCDSSPCSRFGHRMVHSSLSIITSLEDACIMLWAVLPIITAPSAS